MRVWWRRFLGTFVRRDEVEEELRFHLEMAENDAARRGLTDRESRIRAGGIAQAAEAVRDQGRLGWLFDGIRDLRHGVRLMRQSPVYTAAAIASLALGIGANTAIFSLIDTLMLRMIPVYEPDRLAQMTRFRGTSSRASISYPLFRHLKQNLRSFDGVLAHSPMGRPEVVFDGDGEPVTAEIVSGNYYTVLGVSPAAGRLFDESVDRNPEAVAVISHAFWKRRFGLDPAVIGRTFRLHRTVFTITGVTPPEFFGVAVGAAPEITFPLSLDGAVRGGESWHAYDSRSWLSVIGRLGRGQSLAGGEAETRAVFAAVVQAEAGRMPKESLRKQVLAQWIRLEPAGSGLNDLRLRFSEPLWLLMGIVALVLLIACANLANLLLGRAAARRREIAIRLAMGAGRGRVVRQLLAEGALLAAAGGALGVLLAWWSANALVTMMSNGAERIVLHIVPDARVLAFAIAVSAAACLLFSLAPALRATNLSEEARGAARWRMGRALIAAQVAISVLLLIGAGLFGRTLLNLYSMETGFHGGDVHLFSVSADRAGIEAGALRSRILTDLREAPGVIAATFAISPIGPTGWDGSIRLEGYTFGPNENDQAHLNYIGADYFKTLRTALAQGREFGARDVAGAPPVAIVNQAFARRFYNGQTPLGKWVNIAGEPERMEIVGVTEDVRARHARREAAPAVFMPVAQGRIPAHAGGFLFRGKADAAVIDTMLKRIDPRLSAVDIRSLDEHLSRGILRERLMGTLAGFFGGLSLLLVCVGVYGVMAFQVARRQKEIGIRMALGARPRQVIQLILGETAAPVLAGVVTGAAGAMALTGLAEKMLFGVKPADPATFAGAGALLVTMALLAAYLPGRMATRLNPVDTLRAE